MSRWNGLEHGQHYAADNMYFSILICTVQHVLKLSIIHFSQDTNIYNYYVEETVSNWATFNLKVWNWNYVYFEKPLKLLYNHGKVSKA